MFALRSPAVKAFDRRALSVSASLAAKKHELFDRILIANRGEIALRVMRTCKKLGIETVAVYSEADAKAQHTLKADHRYFIGPPPSSQSYLNIDKIIEACKETGAQAVHPGYGFLSERANFAEKLEKNGIVFIGPKPHALTVMGDKLESKRIAREAHVNTIPGFTGSIDDADHAVKIANEVGYPVMVKAAAGGGGKGMRIAWNDDECREGFRFSKNEAKSSFGDDRILIEKFIEEPRHIEVQVLGDGFGNTVYLNERECSIQRRNQKVIEEAPSVFLDDVTRKAMGEQACKLARAVQYQSAGTVEMLVDKHRNFFFLEMNTRLQVEHPITEEITGVDIVEQMIRIAAGQKLKMQQSDIGINGWAFEARVYAEDPYRFLPNTGRISTYQDPGYLDTKNIRVESAIVEGSDISIYYDPLICKLVTHGPNRKAALDLLAKALDRYIIKGVTHNIPLLRDILTKKSFIEGRLSTNFIKEEYPNGFQGYQLSGAEASQLAITGAVMSAIRHLADGTTQLPPYHVTFGEKTLQVKVAPQADGSFHASVDGAAPVPVKTPWYPGQYLFDATIGDTAVIIQHAARESHKLKLRFHGTLFDVEVRTNKEQQLNSLMPKKSKADQSNQVLSPMPGLIVSLAVQPGSTVTAGSEVAVMEAMKMQNKLVAPRTGVVKAIHFKAGDTVEGDVVIIDFEPEVAPAAKKA